MAADIEVGKTGSVGCVKDSSAVLARGRPGYRPVFAPRPPPLPLSSASAASSAVTLQPAVFSPRASFLNAARARPS